MDDPLALRPCCRSIAINLHTPDCTNVPAPDPTHDLAAQVADLRERVEQLEKDRAQIGGALSDINCLWAETVKHRHAFGTLSATGRVYLDPMPERAAAPTDPLVADVRDLRERIRQQDDRIARLIDRIEALEAAAPAAPVDPWGPPRPMSELPDGHLDPVMIGYRDGDVERWRWTHRDNDAKHGRVCWWPYPEVPAELREADRG